MDKYKRFLDIINEANTITILSGAGISTNSGIPDFRSREGLYKDIKPEETISRKSYENDKQKFWKDYKEIFVEKLNLENVEPNNAHEFPKMLKELGKKVYVVTQNVDGLYGGLVAEEDVIEYHGNISKLRCNVCEKEESSKILLNIELSKEMPTCRYCGKCLDVCVTLFGDIVKEHEKAEKFIQNSDVVIVMGTTLAVEPFSRLLTGNRKRKNILMNNENIAKKRFELKFIQDISKTVEEIEKRKDEMQ